MNAALATRWTPDRTLRGLLAWTALTTLVFWLPTVRGVFDGPSYQWGLAGFAGRGTSGDYWFPLLGSAFAIAVQVLAGEAPACRSRRRYGSRKDASRKG